RGEGLVNRAAQRKRVEFYLRVRAQRPADPLKSVGAAARSEISDGKEAAVAGADADGVGSAARLSSPCPFPSELASRRLLARDSPETGERSRQSSGRARQCSAATSAPARLREDQAVRQRRREKNEAKRHKSACRSVSGRGRKGPNQSAA